MYQVSLAKPHASYSFPILQTKAFFSQAAHVISRIAPVDVQVFHALINDVYVVLTSTGCNGFPVWCIEELAVKLVMTYSD